MQGLKRLQEAIERHRENKDINIKYKTPLTSKCPFHPLPALLRQATFQLPVPPPRAPAFQRLTLTANQTVRNVNTFTDEQAIDDACNPIRCNRSVRISEWVRGYKEYDNLASG